MALKSIVFFHSVEVWWTKNTKKYSCLSQASVFIFLLLFPASFLLLLKLGLMQNHLFSSSNLSNDDFSCIYFQIQNISRNGKQKKLSYQRKTSVMEPSLCKMFRFRLKKTFLINNCVWKVLDGLTRQMIHSHWKPERMKQADSQLVFVSPLKGCCRKC